MACALRTSGPYATARVSLLGNHCATSTDFNITEHPWDCMLTVLMLRVSHHAGDPDFEAQQGIIWSGLFVAATTGDLRGSPPPPRCTCEWHSRPCPVVESGPVHRRALRSLRSLNRRVAILDADRTNRLMSSCESLCIIEATTRWC